MSHLSKRAAASMWGTWFRCCWQIDDSTLLSSFCRILQGADRPVGEVHEPNVHQDLRAALHPEFTRVPGTVCGAPQILFWLFSTLYPFLQCYHTGLGTRLLLGLAVLVFMLWNLFLENSPGCGCVESLIMFRALPRPWGLWLRPWSCQTRWRCTCLDLSLWGLCRRPGARLEVTSVHLWKCGCWWQPAQLCWDWAAFSWGEGLKASAVDGSMLIWQLPPWWFPSFPDEDKGISFFSCSISAQSFGIMTVHWNDCLHAWATVEFSVFAKQRAWLLQCCIEDCTDPWQRCTEHDIKHILELRISSVLFCFVFLSLTGVLRRQRQSVRGSVGFLVPTGGAPLLSGQSPVSVQWRLPGVCQQTRRAAAAFWGHAAQVACASAYHDSTFFGLTWTVLITLLLLLPPVKRWRGLLLLPGLYHRACQQLGILSTKQQRWVVDYSS